jgi:hypothetical protein
MGRQIFIIEGRLKRMSAIRKLTGMGGDVRQIAKLLQAKAPPGHKLAFINEEEAELLKRRGGSGRITPEGIPSYELDDNLQISGASPATETPTTAPVSMPDIQATTLSPASNTGDISAPSSLSTNYSIAPQAAGVPSTAPITSGFSPSVDYSLTPAGTTFTPGGTAVGQTSDASAPQLGETGGQPIAATPTAPEKSFGQKTLDYLGQSKTLAALGIGGTQAILGANAVKKAQNEAAQAKQQLQSMAAPYQQQGQQLQQLANQGQLTPANQQTLQAARAQLSQGAEARGGVGAAQAANQIANLTQSLLANQMNMGIQLQGVGDKIAQGAIQTGIQADQYINQLTSSYAQNIARTVAGATGLPGQNTTTTTVQQTS